jgi:TonB family protein
MLHGRAILGGALLSVGAHLLVALLLLRLPAAPAVSASADRRPYEVPVQPVGHPAGTPGARRAGNAPTDHDRAVPGGARAAQNIDARDRGRGGDGTGAAAAILMMNRDDGILLFDSPLNNLAASQSQRIRTARDRATLERRRATPNPHDQPFLASGDGPHRERRPVSARDAAEGARVAPEASVEGARPSVARPGAAGVETPGGPSTGGTARAVAQRASASASERGAAEASPGRGILGGTGSRRTAAADVAHGRPPVDEGPAATLAREQDPRIRDDVDAELLTQMMRRSWTDATDRSGRRVGVGRGGVGGGGAPGSGGGRREGGRAAIHGPGDGRYAALDTSDRRYRMWFLRNRRRVYDALRFPRERALRMDQGTSIYRVVVRRDGSLAGAPHLVRSSGFEDIDRAALAAIRAATPFSPLPDDLAPERERIRLLLPIELSNPMVR